MYTRRDLHHIALDVEMVLISVVQGVALTTLATEAAPALRAHAALAWPFAATGLVFVLSFWSVALVHAVSFLGWPLDLVHYFGYFAVALLECLTFTCMQHPRAWFGYSIACFAMSLALYAYDHRLILRRRDAFGGDDASRALYAHIVSGQRFEMAVLMPAGFAFSLAAWALVVARPAAATPLAVAQLAFTLGFLAYVVRRFGARQRLIEACAHD